MMKPRHARSFTKTDHTKNGLPGRGWLLAASPLWSSIFWLILFFCQTLSSNLVYADVGNQVQHNHAAGDDFTHGISEGHSSGFLFYTVFRFGRFFFFYGYRFGPIVGTIWLCASLLLTYVAWRALSKRGSALLQSFFASKSPVQPASAPNTSAPTESNAILNPLMQQDPLFDPQAFLLFAEDVFQNLQAAWTAKDWERIRQFESKELYDRHALQLQEYIDKKQTNRVERLRFRGSEYESFAIAGNREVLTIRMAVSLRDTLVNDADGRILEGDPQEDIHMLYRLTFARAQGVKTTQQPTQVQTMRCPCCGAPLQIGASGRCSYCDSIIQNGDHSWVLTNLEGLKQY